MHETLNINVKIMLNISTMQNKVSVFRYIFALENNVLNFKSF